MPLTVERRDGEPAVLLCSDDGRESVILARFSSEDAGEVFKMELARTIAYAHAMGASGI